MSKKTKPPYLLQVPTAEHAALLSEMFLKSAVGAAQAHLLADLYRNVQACMKYFAPVSSDES
jgi:hypothetical protein